MLWACILLPQLAMDSALRQRSNPDAPLALLGGPVQRRQLQAVNRETSYGELRSFKGQRRDDGVDT